MKKTLLPLLFLLLGTVLHAQNGATRFPAVDKSAMDMIYFPTSYPVLKIQDKATEAPAMRIIYSRPQKNGRTVFGELVEYGKVWRLGANEATEIEFFRPVTIGGKKIAKGRYTMYALVQPAQWTLILNKDTDTWGAFKYDEKKDAARITVPVQPTGETVEAFAMNLVKSAAGADLVIAWDTSMVTMPISLK